MESRSGLVVGDEAVIELVGIARRLDAGSTGRGFSGAHWVCRVTDCAPRAQKSADPHQAADCSVEIFVRKIALPHIDPFGSRHLAVSNDRLPDSVSRIAPDASKKINKRAETVCQISPIELLRDCARALKLTRGMPLDGRKHKTSRKNLSAEEKGVFENRHCSRALASKHCAAYTKRRLRGRESSRLRALGRFTTPRKGWGCWASPKRNFRVKRFCRLHGEGPSLVGETRRITLGV